MEEERDEVDDWYETGREEAVTVAEREEERSFLRRTNTLRFEKMDDNFFPPRRTLSRSPLSDNSGTEVGQATAAVIDGRERSDKGRTGGERAGTRRWEES